MKNPFKRNHKPKPEPDPRPEHPNARCVIIGIDEAKAALEDLAKLGQYVRVEHFPENVGPNHAPGKAPWVTTTNISLHDAHGTHYGNKGVEILKAVGLPDCVKGVDLVAEDNGRAIIKSVDCPTAQGIAALVAHVERHTTAILDEYRRFEAMGQYRKKGGSK